MKRLLIFGLIVALCIVAMPAMAASVTPTIIPGADNLDKTCAVVMPGTIELKYDAEPPDGTTPYSDGTLSVSIVKPSTLAGSLNSFDWTKTSGSVVVMGVIVKDGVDGANWYDYSPDGSTADTYLTTPFDGDKGISHISFCYTIEVCDCETDSDCVNADECETGVCDQECTCVYTQDSVGAPCEGGKCNGEGVCVPDIPVPEFPTIALPAALIIGLLGTVLFIQGTRKQ